MPRADFDRLRVAHDDLREQLRRVREDCTVQFKRTAQIQAELDELRRNVRKLQRA